MILEGEKKNDGSYFVVTRINNNLAAYLFRNPLYEQINFYFIYIFIILSSIVKEVVFFTMLQ